MLKIYLTNLGKYNEGELIGKWLELPTTEEELKNTLNEIGINENYEEYFINDYDCDIDEIIENLGEYEDLVVLNALGEQLSELNEHELKKLSAVANSLYTIDSPIDSMNLIYNLANYRLYTDVKNEYDLGVYYAEELECIEIPETLQPYFDYEMYGKDCSLNTIGDFTKYGYVEDLDDSFIEAYTYENFTAENNESNEFIFDEEMDL